ncbi:hypothetical protein HanIR_Chr17g0894191 [Helianthus annuus]|nr:hypothetical protein HanIR_Chr17g0894191 [Helianthus annuus]
MMGTGYVETRENRWKPITVRMLFVVESAAGRRKRMSTRRGSQPYEPGSHR